MISFFKRADISERQTGTFEPIVSSLQWFHCIDGNIKNVIVRLTKGLCFGYNLFDVVAKSRIEQFITLVCENYTYVTVLIGFFQKETKTHGRGYQMKHNFIERGVMKKFFCKNFVIYYQSLCCRNLLIVRIRFLLHKQKIPIHICVLQRNIETLITNRERKKKRKQKQHNNRKKKPI